MTISGPDGDNFSSEKYFARKISKDDNKLELLESKVLMA